MHLIDLGYQTAGSDMKSSLPALEKNIGEARHTRNSSFLAAALTQRGQVNVSMGLLDEGRRSFEEAILLSKKTATGANMMLGLRHNWLAEVLLERGDHAEAAIQSAEANELISDSPMRSPVLFIQATTAQVFAAVGNTEAAIESLGKAQTFVQGSSDSRFYSFLSSVNLKVYCSIGDLQLATDVVRERELTPDVEVTRDNEEEITAYARYLIAVGEYTGAEQACSNVLPVVQEAGHVQHEIHALVLHASASELLGKHPLALESIGTATSLGEPGRFNRSFTGEGPVVVGLVKALADATRRGRGPAEVGTLPYLTYLLDESGVEPDTALTQAAAGDLVEPLTEREIEILRHIVAGMTNQDIAEQLVVSMSTVKTHINRTYRKLDVQSRTQAIARIRQLGIV